MPRLILGSSSPRRKDLLAQIGIMPDIIKGPDIDETPHKGEIPDQYVVRLAIEKNIALQSEFPDDFIITADTTGALGRRILGKPEDHDDAEKMVRLLSGRSHLIHTGVAVKAPGKKIAHRLSTSRIKFKRLSDPEIRAFLDSNDWVGCAAGYKLMLHMNQHILHVSGSPTGIIGLPLYETMQLLTGLGYKTDTATP
jgi:septum formation protein